VADPQPVSWRAIRADTPVRSSDDGVIGTVREVLGSDGEDIFHGLRVALNAGHRDVLVSADDITNMTSDGIGTDLSGPEADSLPTYDEAATYHLASVGWLRKHLGWKRDSKSDEEPG
jgi:hypothetical protein